MKFTVIELLIGGLIVAVLAAAFASQTGQTLSFGVNGITETRCIDGMCFVVGRDGQARQVFDDFGKGVRCQ